MVKDLSLCTYVGMNLFSLTSCEKAFLIIIRQLLDSFFFLQKPFCPGDTKVNTHPSPSIEYIYLFFCIQTHMLASRSHMFPIVASYLSMLASRGAFLHSLFQPHKDVYIFCSVKIPLLPGSIIVKRNR